MEPPEKYETRPPKRRRLSPPESGPYVLRKVLENIPLTTEDGNDQVSITCVEYWSRYVVNVILQRWLTMLQATVCTLGHLQRRSFI